MFLSWLLKNVDTNSVNHTVDVDLTLEKLLSPTMLRSHMGESTNSLSPLLYIMFKIFLLNLFDTYLNTVLTALMITIDIIH